MSAVLGSRELLHYDTQHRVLICRECTYAIQKSALSSHLLRHKIYRGERQRLMFSVVKLEILEPDDVQIPPPGSPPVDGLPVISGHRCTATSCESLCASSKRMRRHWSEAHGVSDPPGSCAVSVSLQTFFRGTKLRYFEVSLVTGAGSSAHQNDSDPNPEATPAPLQSSLSPSGPPWEINLETLRYFHHFTTTTSFALPTQNEDAGNHWQKEVVTQALRLPWLMCGLLSVSASHMAALSDDEMDKRIYLEQSNRFFHDFIVAWEGVKSSPNVAEGDEVKVGAQIICVQQCYHWTCEGSTPGLEITASTASFQLQSFIDAVQGCADPEIALRSVLNNDITAEEALDQTTMEIEMGKPLQDKVSNAAPPALLKRLCTLPYRMAEVLDRPDDPQQFFASLRALNSLVECSSLSYASDNAETAWMGMASWLLRSWGHFKQMLYRSHPAALIVFAHWLLLVERAQRHYWFLSGLATRALHEVVRVLPEDRALRSLVEDLMPSV
ncbi:hypothetical protein EJ08DRAFT_257391 [Tothia fuscella]|uniref:C2H2-type domain-containing protein n=1 Tax=Tothia fuscella TaxID=1048955 RepID=A0A9P4NQV6_9PEZI|nr:hypothetical protein EJ08DRAFT_257391 [Tothia fuscella]